jgi:hypothetical protein
VICHRRIVLTICAALILPSVGCRSPDPKTPVARESRLPARKVDPCAEAVRHYELEDIPDEEIVSAFQQLTDAGDVRGNMWIARLYNMGKASLPKRPEAAQQMAASVISEVAKLAEKNDPEAQFLMAAAYHQGLGAERDFEKAAAWYEKAVKSAHVTSMNNFGTLLALGHGTAPDIARARKLFSRAAEAGSKLAVENLAKFDDDGRDDQKRLEALRSVSLVRALGLKKNAGIAFLERSGLISDPKNDIVRDYQGREQHQFKADGIVIEIDVGGRITNVEAHSKGSRDSDQFKGEIPLGLSWDMTATSALQILGPPDDQGDVQNDGAYGMAYRTENVFFAAMFSYEGERKLKLWRVYEKWATKYPERVATRMGGVTF